MIGVHGMDQRINQRFDDRGLGSTSEERLHFTVKLFLLDWTDCQAEFRVRTTGCDSPGQIDKQSIEETGKRP